ncbi:NusG domain II-containing protein [Anaerosphaera multitolerans]|uniref:NusG domain II-containing protein n=1 Tax=Anaerosphaera multitolerans TaxID=2487351 RepID=A0A437S7D4_9FIRM|nr:NusG domain II-containing protein [Anaerosphaera multitolerans]RVU54970.1 NusG domain II-containing protein [Anaerosphaera multitolerans]
MKKGDYIVTLLIILIAFSIFSYSASRLNTSSEKYLVININGEIVDKYKLDKNLKDKEIIVNSKFGKNILVIENNHIYIKDSTCKDKTCIKMGKISEIGQSLVCLPNRLMVSIEVDQYLEDEVDVILQ